MSGMSPAPVSMALSSPCPIVSRLPDYILWSIFIHNSTARDPIEISPDCGLTVFTDGRTREGALVCNRNSSQVCSQWRQVILASSILWSNALDICSLNQNSSNWRNEVLTRTGRSPLTVVGRLAKSDKNFSALVHFTIGILGDHWERIRVLSLLSYSEKVAIKLRSVVAMRRAPLMESFAYLGSTSDRSQFTYSVLFDNHAPLLQSFCYEDIHYITGVGKLWCSNLRCFRLVAAQEHLSPRELLRGLGNMPQLESLFIENFEPFLMGSNNDLESAPSMISLSRLSEITIHSSTNVFVKVITHIKAGEGCFLRIHNDKVRSNIMGEAEHAYTVFFCNNFTSHTADLTFTRFLSQTDSDTSQFCVCLGASKLGIRRFEYQMDYGRSSANIDISYSIARAVSNALMHMPKITSLTFDLSDVDAMHSDPGVENISLLFQELAYVEELHATERTLQFLLQFRRVRLLPNLKTVFCREITGCEPLRQFLRGSLLWLSPNPRVECFQDRSMCHRISIMCNPNLV